MERIGLNFEGAGCSYNLYIHYMQNSQNRYDQMPITITSVIWITYEKTRECLWTAIVFKVIER
jgi:hypothetical protein